MMEVLRPYGVVIDGNLELGLELAFDGVWKVRPHTGIPDLYVISPPFCNAHSHFEYRGLLHKVPDLPYWPWIRELTRLKPTQFPSQVVADCSTAAKENLATGIKRVWEHSDRPGSLEAMTQAGLGGRLFFELITFFEHEDSGAKRAATLERLTASPKGIELGIAPHATYTVDEATLRWAAGLKRPLSIHLCETEAEREFFEQGSGVIAQFYKESGVPFEVQGCSPVKYLDECGILGPDTQLVHCCDITDEDIEAIARSGSRVAHCPRSNFALGCPVSPVRRIIEAGIPVGIGLDSAASSGPIDMFAEMRACLAAGSARGEPISPGAAWRCATDAADGEVAIEGTVLAIEVAGAHTTEDLLQLSRPELCRMIQLEES